MTAAEQDAVRMAAALALARRGLGRCGPNPAVGCIVVDPQGRVRGRGSTQPGGRPHAERVALAQAGPAAAGGTAYVTLEPCFHQGETPPCSAALAAAGIARVVAAVRDPDPRTYGRGIAQLREAGVTVREAVGAPAARRLNAGFFLRQGRGRPLIHAKIASSVDGRIATAAGASRWITSRPARAWSHALRARSDAVLIGSGTAAADDPSLDCRLPGLADRSPTRVVLDGRLRLPSDSRLVATAQSGPPTWLVTASGHGEAALAPYRAAGLRVLEVPPDGDGHPELGSALAVLAKYGLNSVMVEGGGQLLASLARAGWIDVLDWVAAPSLMGGDGVPALAALGLTAPAEAPRFAWAGSGDVGGDRWLRLVRADLDAELEACLPA